MSTAAFLAPRLPIVPKRGHRKHSEQRQHAGRAGFLSPPKQHAATIPPTTTQRRRQAIRSCELRQWAEGEGAKVDKRLEVVDGVLQVSDDVAKGTELLVLPASMLITSDALEDMGVARAQARALGEDTALAAAVMRAESGFEWVRELRTGDAPYLWSETELAALEGSPLRGRAEDARRELREEHAAHADVLGDGDGDTADAFLSAVAKVRAHAVRVGGKQVMAPYAACGETAMEGDENGMLQSIGGGFFGKPKYTLLATKSLDAGEKISLVRVERGVEAASALLEVGCAVGVAARSLRVELSKFDRFYDDKLAILERQQLAAEESFVLLENDSDDASASARMWTPPEEMLAYLRLVCLTGVDAFLLEPVFNNQVWYFMLDAVSEENERAMCEFVLGACDDMLDAYTETTQLRVSDAPAPEPERARLAKYVIDGERRIVEACKLWFERRIKTLGEIRYYQERRLDELDLLRPIDESEIVDGGSGVRIGRAFDDNY